MASKRHYTENYAMIDSIRACLGLEPLYVGRPRTELELASRRNRKRKVRR